MRIVIDYNSCPPSSYNKEFMEELGRKVEALEKNLDTMVFHLNRYDKNGVLEGTQEFTLESQQTKPLAIEFDLDNAGDELWVALDTEIPNTVTDGHINYLDSLYLEVVTKEVAEGNDKDFLQAEYYDLKKSGEYEVGNENSYYKQIGDTEFYYREM